MLFGNIHSSFYPTFPSGRRGDSLPSTPSCPGGGVCTGPNQKKEKFRGENKEIANLSRCPCSLISMQILTLESSSAPMPPATTAPASAAASQAQGRKPQDSQPCQIQHQLQQNAQTKHQTNSNRNRCS